MRGERGCRAWRLVDADRRCPVKAAVSRHGERDLRVYRGVEVAVLPVGIRGSVGAGCELGEVVIGANSVAGDCDAGDIE